MDIEKHADMIAEKLVEAVRRSKAGGAMFGYFQGVGPFKLESFPGAGHNYYEVLKSFYRLHLKNPNLECDKCVFKGLKSCILMSGTPKAFTMCANYIVAQVEFEKNGISPFKLDCIELLSYLRKSLDECCKDDKDADMIYENAAKFVSDR